MPAPVPADTRNPQLLTLLFWGGVALAPVAALILLVADGNGPLRFAAVLAISAVVLIGLSIALRTEGGGRPAAAELHAEVDELRRELRSEIVAAAQRGNQALDEVQRVQEALAGLRRRVESGVAPAGGEEPASPGRARVPAAEAPARHTERPAGQAGVYGAAQSVHGVAQPDPGVADGYGNGNGPGGERPATGYGGERPGYRGERPTSGSAGVYGSPVRAEQDNRAGESVPRSLGVVRHTETVHVTTRHTIVDGGVGESGGRYGAGYPGTWSAPQPGERPRGGHGADRDDSWSDGDDRYRRDEGRRWDGAARHDDRSWSGPAQEHERPWAGTGRDDDDRSWSGSPGEGEHSWSAPRDERPWAASHDEWSTARDGGHGYHDDQAAHHGTRDWGSPRDDRGGAAGVQPWEAPAEPVSAARTADTGEYWAQLRAGDRWATVRDDDRGRELRVGERRAEVHAEPGGAEYRVEDRWASVRRDEPRRATDGDGSWRAGLGEPEARPALPAGGVPVPQEWRPHHQRGHQPESARGHQPEPAYGYRPQAEQGYQPEPTRGPRPGGEPYGRRHHVEEPVYGHHDGTSRWR